MNWDEKTQSLILSRTEFAPDRLSRRITGTGKNHDGNKVEKTVFGYFGDALFDSKAKFNGISPTMLTEIIPHHRKCIECGLFLSDQRINIHKDFSYGIHYHNWLGTVTGAYSKIKTVFDLLEPVLCVDCREDTKDTHTFREQQKSEIQKKRWL